MPYFPHVEYAYFEYNKKALGVRKAMYILKCCSLKYNLHGCLCEHSAIYTSQIYSFIIFTVPIQTTDGPYSNAFWCSTCKMTIKIRIANFSAFLSTLFEI